MSYLETPMQTMLSDLKTILTNNIADATFYDHWIPHAPKLPAVSFFPVFGSQEEVGLGEVLDSSTKAVWVVYTVQIDVWARVESTAKSLADKVKLTLWKNRSSMGNIEKDIVLTGERWLNETARVRGGEEVLYRVSQSYRCKYAMTRSA